MTRRPPGPVVALGMFTLLPMPAVTQVDRPLARRTMRAFPLVGTVCGALAAMAAGLVTGLHGGRALAAVCALGVLAAVTGALHLDGLADTADGLGSRRPAEQALAVMRRSDIGPMGVVSLVFVLLLDAAALVRLADAGPATTGAALVVGATAARTVVVQAATRPGARTSGFGALFAGVSTASDWLAGVLWSLVLVAGLGLLAGHLDAGRRPLVALAVGTLVSWLVGWCWQCHLLRRLGGLTGDTFGSLVEVSLASFLMATALALGAG